MGNLPVCLAIALLALAPQAALANGPSPPQSRESDEHSLLGAQQPKLIDVGLIPKGLGCGVHGGR